MKTGIFLDTLFGWIFIRKNLDSYTILNIKYKYCIFWLRCTLKPTPSRANRADYCDTEHVTTSYHTRRKSWEKENIFLNLYVAVKKIKNKK